MCLWKPESLWQGARLQLFFWGRLSSPLQVTSVCPSAKVHDICCVLTQGGISSGNSRAQGCGYFMLTHEFLEGRDSIWEHSFSRIRVTVVLPRELNKQPLTIEKMMVYISFQKKRGDGDCSWRGYRMVATLYQTWKSKEIDRLKVCALDCGYREKKARLQPVGPARLTQRAWYT